MCPLGDKTAILKSSCQCSPRSASSITAILERSERLARMLRCSSLSFSAVSRERQPELPYHALSDRLATAGSSNEGIGFRVAMVIITVGRRRWELRSCLCLGTCFHMKMDVVGEVKYAAPRIAVSERRGA